MPEDLYYKEEIESKDFTISLATSETSDEYSEFDVTATKNTVTSKSPVSLAWKNLTYEITDPKTKKPRKIIQNVSGIVNPGEVLASKC